MFQKMMNIILFKVTPGGARLYGHNTIKFLPLNYHSFTTRIPAEQKDFMFAVVAIE